MPPLVKTTGSKGMHVYVPIVRGPVQKEVWTFAKALAVELASRHPTLMTAEYRVAKRPRGPGAGRLQPERVGADAGVDLLRAPDAARDGVDAGRPGRRSSEASQIEDFRLDNVRERIAKVGDLWKPLLGKRGLVDLRKLLDASAPKARR